MQNRNRIENLLLRPCLVPLIVGWDGGCARLAPGTEALFRSQQQRVSYLGRMQGLALSVPVTDLLQHGIVRPGSPLRLIVDTGEPHCSAPTPCVMLRGDEEATVTTLRELARRGELATGVKPSDLGYDSFQRPTTASRRVSSHGPE